MDFKKRIANFEKLFIPMIAVWTKLPTIRGYLWIHKHHQLLLMSLLTGFTIEWRWDGSSEHEDRWVRWDASKCEYKVSRSIPNNKTQANLYYDDGFDLRDENAIEGIWPDLKRRSLKLDPLPLNKSYEREISQLITGFFQIGGRTRMQHNPATCSLEAMEHM